MSMNGVRSPDAHRAAAGLSSALPSMGKVEQLA